MTDLDPTYLAHGYARECGLTPETSELLDALLNGFSYDEATTIAAADGGAFK